MNASRRLGAAALLACLAVASAPAPEALADFRVGHLSPGAPAVDIFAGLSDDSKAEILSDVPYTAVSGYQPLASGSYFIDVRSAEDDSLLLDVNGLELDGSLDYTILAVNTPDQLEPLVLVDDNTLLPGMARLRAVHASPNAGTVDLRLLGPDSFDATISNVEFKAATDYLTLTPGAYTAQLLTPGTTDVLLEVELVLDASRVYTAFAIGLAGDSATPLTAIATVDAVPEPAAFVLLGVGGLACLGWARRRRARAA